MKFTKMHGIGNDYVFVNCLEERVDKPEGLSKKISDRHFGVGSDGLVLILPSKKADFKMRIFNPDGSEAEMCGNAIRCVAKYVYERNLTKKKDLEIETLAGIMKPKLMMQGNKVEAIQVDMGPPRLLRKEIPMLGDEYEKVVNEPLKVEDEEYKITCVSMGNPHCILYVDDVDTAPVKELGPQIENHKLFPKRTNVEFVQVLNKNEIKMRVWERGAGETLACGTGASASVVASVLNNKTNKKVTVHLLGGDLEIEWSDNGHVYMTGPAEEVFDGVYEW